MTHTIKNALCISAAAAILILAGCGRHDGFDPAQYAGMLRADSGPAACGDAWPVSLFSDQGAWFGFGLPDSLQVFPGQFSGPFFHVSGEWAGTSLIGLRVTDHENGGQYDFTAAETSRSLQPGRLVQVCRFADLEITLTLIFISGRSALVTAEFMSLSGFHLALDIEWYGTADTAVTAAEAAVRFPAGKKGTMAALRTAGPARVVVAPDQKQYRIITDSDLHVSTADKFSRSLIFTVQYPGDSPGQETELIESALADPVKQLEENRARWSRLLAPFIASTGSDAPAAEDLLAARAMMTLMNNQRHARGGLRHAGVIPSGAVSYFNGFWGWDSWKHAAALAPADPALAADQIRAMFDYQRADGMLPDCIYADTTENNWRNSKPPLASWAVWQVYRATADSTFLREMLPGLTAFHRWWYDFRDHDGNGLCEYGCTDGTLTAARWESGMDDGVRFDDSRLIKNSSGAWSLNQESVDLNSYLFADKQYLARICEALDESALAARFFQEAEILGDQIRSKMFDPGSGFFYDIRLETGEFVPVAGPEGWVPLWAGAADSSQASAVRKMMLDPRKFFTRVPLPTVPADHPAFMSGYWRGPVWLDQFWFGVNGLTKYGFIDDARMISRRLLDNAEGLMTPGAPIHENYDPRSGRGLNAPHFSWSAAHLLLLLRDGPPVSAD